MSERRRPSLAALCWAVAAALVLAGLWAPLSKKTNDPALSAAASEEPQEWWSKSALEPCGEVTLLKEPQRIVTFNHNHNDMLETFGWGGRVIGTGYPKSFYYAFYKEIPGFDWKVRKETGGLQFFQYQPAGTFDKELFYKMHADIHHIDPNRLGRMKGWSMNDVEEIKQNIAPFFDNNATMLGDDAVNRNWGVFSGQVYYTFEEYTRAFYKLYRQEERCEKLLQFIHALEDRVKAKLEGQPKPRLALLRWKGNEITRVGINSGIEHLQYRTLQVRDAFKGQEWKVLPKVEDKSVLMGRLDLEGLLAIDPDIIIMPYIIYTFENDNHIMAKPWETLLSMRDDPVGQKLSAFKNGRVYPGGILMQGPIFYCFQLEMAAKQIYPQLFGEWRQDHKYPPEEQLFSREELAKLLR